MDALQCTLKHLLQSHPHICIALALPLLIVLAYWLTHPHLIPGDRHTVLFLFSDAKGPQPYCSSLSPFSHVYARLNWAWHALRRGTTPGGLAAQVRKDYQIDWLAGERPKNGDLINAWDRVFEWNQDCIDMAGLEAMRDLGDPLSEKVLDAFADMPKDEDTPHDTLERVAQSQVGGQTNKDLASFWHAVDRRPPPGCGALSLEWYYEHGMITAKELKDYGHCEATSELVKQPSWTPEQEQEFQSRLRPHHQKLIDAEEARILQRGRDTFHKYGPNLQIGLLLVGLAGGFASPRIIEVLKSTGYLVQPRRQRRNKSDDEQEEALLDRLNEYMEKGRNEVRERRGSPPLLPARTNFSLDVPSDATSDRTYRRLLETTTFNLDLMETADSLQPPSSCTSSSAPRSGAELLQRAGKGWLACCRVRFLHTSVRRRLHSGKVSSFDASKGLAINQEDLMGTLCAFTVAPLWALQRLGLPASAQERSDLVAFWRHVGFYMGIEPRLLRRHFRDVAAAERTFCCISSHHFLPFAGLTDSSSTPPPSIPTTFGPGRARMANEDKHGALQTTRQFVTLASHFDFNSGPALPLLWATAERAPGNMPFSVLCATARYLIGPGLANATCMPLTRPWQFFMMRVRMLVLAYPVLFGLYYPRKRWAVGLRENWILLIRRIVIWCSESKRTSFATSKDGSHDDTYAACVLDPKQGTAIVKQYRGLMYEMLGVTLLLALFATGGAVYLWSTVAATLRALPTCTV